MPLALYTFGMFAARADDPVNDGFHARNDAVMTAIERAPGFIARSGYASDEGPASWGDEVYPSFYEERGDGWSPATLSLWENAESAVAATYSGVHVEALKHGREWFELPRWPPLVAWWHGAAERPTWAEGVRRHAYLHEHGPTSFAFSFKATYAPDGTQRPLDRDRIRILAKG